jgi:DNA-binding CsgD family transcriptional regulator
VETREVLTDREFEVLCHIAWGGRTDGIAHTLGLSPDTIKFHVTQILRKLGARNRSHAVALAYRRGILQTGDLAGWAITA